MKKITLFPASGCIRQCLALLFAISILGCNKDAAPPAEPEEMEIETPKPDSILIIREGINDTLSFYFGDCAPNDTLINPFLAESVREDSFSIDRRASIRIPNEEACLEANLQIGIRVRDEIAQYPFTDERLEEIFKGDINNQLNGIFQFFVNTRLNCTAYQNREPVFGDDNHLPYFPANPNFQYEITDYDFNPVAGCEKGRDAIRLKGHFSGYLYTTPNVTGRDSIDIRCEGFDVLIKLR